MKEDMLLLRAEIGLREVLVLTRLDALVFTSFLLPESSGRVILSGVAGGFVVGRVASLDDRSKLLPEESAKFADPYRLFTSLCTLDGVSAPLRLE